jgi:hypothetical protein
MGNIGSMRSRDLMTAANLSEGLGGAPMRNTMAQMDMFNILNNQGQSDSMTPLIQSLLQMTQQGGNAANAAGAQQTQFWNQLGQNLSGAYGNRQTGRGGGQTPGGTGANYNWGNGVNWNQAPTGTGANYNWGSGVNWNQTPTDDFDPSRTGG